MNTQSDFQFFLLWLSENPFIVLVTLFFGYLSIAAIADGFSGHKSDDL
ncbi:hypothetical protein SAMN05216327_101223 [Dyadobacter sp. SG02]|nr:hypothetical protein [Dyadobacter sp. SG02]SEI39733.1 hypothetical protein SAMN05216327_101223 [Dyadobacter sp. SG02]